MPSQSLLLLVGSSRGRALARQPKWHILSPQNLRNSVLRSQSPVFVASHTGTILPRPDPEPALLTARGCSLESSSSRRNAVSAGTSTKRNHLRRPARSPEADATSLVDCQHADLLDRAPSQMLGGGKIAIQATQRPRCFVRIDNARKQAGPCVGSHRHCVETVQAGIAIHQLPGRSLGAPQITELRPLLRGRAYAARAFRQPRNDEFASRERMHGEIGLSAARITELPGDPRTISASAPAGFPARSDLMKTIEPSSVSRAIVRVTFCSCSPRKEAKPVPSGQTV